MSKTIKYLLIFSILCNVILASLLIYNHSINKAKEIAVTNKISAKAKGIQASLRNFSTSDDELIYLFLLSNIKSLNDIDEYTNYIDESYRIYDALIVIKDEVRTNVEELIDIYSLIEIDYKNPEIQNKINQFLGNIFL